MILWLLFTDTFIIVEFITLRFYSSKKKPSPSDKDSLAQRKGALSNAQTLAATPPHLVIIVVSLGGYQKWLNRKSTDRVTALLLIKVHNSLFKGCLVLYLENMLHAGVVVEGDGALGGV